MKKYDYVIFIGRFQIFHNIHHNIVKKALKMGKRVILIIGSANELRTEKNPFTVEERVCMIQLAENCKRIIFSSVIDYHNNVKWAKAVQEIVNEIAKPKSKIALIGCFKDQTSYYLKLFPEWEFINVENISGLNATDLRMALYTGNLDKYKKDIHPAILKFLGN